MTDPVSAEPQPDDQVAPPVAEQDWSRLDRRMLLVHPVREIGRFLPVVIGVLVFGRSGEGGWWGLIGVGVPVALGLLRYLTTGYRIAGGRLELRQGLLNKRVVSTPLDRVRTVDMSASPVHRLLGLVTLRVGTGQSGDDKDDRLALDGLAAPAGEELRRRLLHSAPGTPAGVDAPEADSTVVLRLDPSWVRFAPLTSSGLVIAGAALGFVAQAVNTLGFSPHLDAARLEGLGIAILVLIGVLVVGVLLCVLAVAGYLVTNFGFVLSRQSGNTGGDTDGTATPGRSWHLRRGLFTTRQTSLDDARLSGVSIGEPIGLRLAGGARLSAIVTGLDKKQQGSSVLVPPAPRAEVDRVAAAVLGDAAPVTGPLLPHGPRAVRRRWTRALGPALLVAAAAGLASYLWTSWLLPVAVLAPLVGVGLAADRSRALGHALVGRHLVARSGSLDRRREALTTASVIGWNLRATWFQRRAGLTDLVATTAGGRQRVTVLDVPEHDGVTLARTAQPGLLDQFLA